MKEFDNLQFPIIKNVAAKLLANDIISEPVKSFEELTKNKTIKEAENKYSHFNSIQELKEHILNELKKHGGKLNKQDLYAYESAMMPFNIEKDVYVKPYSCNTIGCDGDKVGCIRTGFSVDLNPNNFSLATLNKLIDEIKEE